MTHLPYLVTIEFDEASPEYQAQRQKVAEGEGISLDEVDEWLAERFRNSLEEHLQSEIGQEGFRVKVENLEFREE